MTGALPQPRVVLTIPPLSLHRVNEMVSQTRSRNTGTRAGEQELTGHRAPASGIGQRGRAVDYPVDSGFSKSARLSIASP